MPHSRLLVWDLPVRLFHWLLVISITAAWLTRHARGSWHEWIGYGVAALVVFRLGLGWWGSQYVRFRAFCFSPSQIWRYAKEVVSGKPQRYLSHNPLGAVMVFAQLLLLVACVVSGIMFTTDRFFGYEWVMAIHTWSTYALLLLVPLHVAGVWLASRQHKENLLAAMLHGKKRAGE